ncbi:MAG TPA: rRNA adenine N-6-methyltransferase family protein [Gemmatimonadaceae bacterium]|nr:rRNA adenine N-6-methyltransferase family protein [Gemmatimonadaceae bacterium]
MLERTPTRGEQMLLFARNFLKHPRMLGSVIPSSRFLVDQVLRQVEWQRARVIVEYGPGVGNFTTEILRRMRPDATLVVIEMNPSFVGFLRETIVDSRLHVVEGSAADAAALLAQLGKPSADYVISGIPFTTLAPGVRESVLETTRGILRPDGAFLVYQFTASVLPHLVRFFGHVERRFEPFNVLPAQVFYCQHRAA